MFANPTHSADNLYQNANLKCGIFDYQGALQLYDQALKQDPNHYPSLCAAGEILAAQGNFSACEQVLNKARSLTNKDATAFLPLIALSRLSHNHTWAKALSKEVNALSIPPEVKKRLRMQLKGTPSKPDLKLAHAAYQAAAHAGAQNNIIGCALELLKAIRLGPDNPEAIENLITCLMRLDQIAQAKNITRKFCNIYPREIRYWRILARLADMEQNRELALEAYQNLHQLRPKDSAILSGLAITEIANGNAKAAQSHLATAQTLGADGPEFILAKIRYCIHCGDMADARALAQDHIDRFSDHLLFFLAYAELCNITADSALFSRLQAAATDQQIAPMQRAMILRNLARSYESTDQHEQAFDAYAGANQIIWNSFSDQDRNPQDPAQFWYDFYASKDWPKPLAPQASITPIFIFGLPRSGTTLVEQIIASHSQVASLGESSILSDTFGAFISEHQIDRIDQFSPDMLEELQTTAMQKFADQCGGLPYFADKTLSNYYLLPLAKLIFPNASFIHVQRDPRDNLWSIFKNRFSGSDHSYSYDQDALGIHYNRYRAFMAYLAQNYGSDYYQQNYEDLIASQDAQSRALIAHCNLDWQDACLEFYNNKNAVRTLSVAQVRQPIYQSSVALWRHYEPHLETLFNRLKEAKNYPSDD